jgi:hypothetical protein
MVSRSSCPACRGETGIRWWQCGGGPRAQPRQCRRCGKWFKISLANRLVSQGAAIVAAVGAYLLATRWNLAEWLEVPVVIGSGLIASVAVSRLLLDLVSADPPSFGW